MKKILYMLIAMPLLFVALTACNDGDRIIENVIEIEPFTIDGFIVGDTLEQYFDGKKVRDLYLRPKIGITNEIAFTSEETIMEFRARRTGKTVYTQTFNIHDETNVVPKFYYDGETVYDHFPRPTPAEGEYLINFYFEFPDRKQLVDVVQVMLEYYYDASGSMIFMDTVVTPIFSNIQPGKWSEYGVLPAPPDMPHSRPDSEFYPVVCLRRAGQTESFYFGDDLNASYCQIQQPSPGAMDSKVQSMYVGALPVDGGTYTLYPQVNLVDMFP